MKVWQLYLALCSFCLLSSYLIVTIFDDMLFTNTRHTIQVLTPIIVCLGVFIYRKTPLKKNKTSTLFVIIKKISKKEPDLIKRTYPYGFKKILNTYIASKSIKICLKKSFS